MLRAANSGKSADPFLHRESPLIKIVLMRQAILKIKLLGIDVNYFFQIACVKVVHWVLCSEPPLNSTHEILTVERRYNSAVSKTLYQ
jgi:hypothetical protein